MNTRTVALTGALTLAAIGTACVPPQTSSVVYRKITADFTVEDCNAYPGGAVTGVGTDAICRIVP